VKPFNIGFQAAEDTPFMTLDSLGCQEVDSASYSFQGNERPDRGHIIFQYTLLGEGRVEIDGTTYWLPEGTAFLVQVPSPHRYYYDSASEQPWKFIWLNARGEDAQRIWDRIIAQEGPVVTLDEHAEPIRAYWKLYHRIVTEQIRDPYILSVLVYEWMLTLLRSRSHATTNVQDSPVILQAKQFMDTHYAQPIVLEEIAASSQVSRHHLCRIFQKIEHCSPFEYLRRRRLDAAVTLLRQSDLPIHEVGVQCGFESPSYFGKVFRQHYNMSPTEYRTKSVISG